MTFEEALDTILKNMDKIHYPPCPENLYAPIRYILSLKGKKIRPALTLLACNLYSEDVSPSIYPALAWEVFHNFTLMHDDVMDKADVRRGQPTVHKKWNENAAILSGDSMLILAYQQMAMAPEKHYKKLLDLFSVTAAEICEGQQYDMEFENRLDVTEEEYIEMIRLKTAVMLGACLKSGGIVGEANPEDTDLLYAFGSNLGIAFQIKDDFLDIYGDPLVFGKAIGGDILCNKKTFFLVNALHLCQETDANTLMHWLNATVYDKTEKIKAVTALYDRLGLKKIAEDKMGVYYKNALEALAKVNVPEEKKVVLYKFAEQLIEREV